MLSQIPLTVDENLPGETGSGMTENNTDYILHLADTNLLLAQRNAAWCGHGPVLEQDIAITNISLDLLGQARNFYQYAARLFNEAAILPTHETTGITGASPKDVFTEDTLAYHRTEREFKNLLITELPRGDWAQTVLRQFFCSAYSYLLYQQLQQSNDVTLAAIAEKSIKEVTYHLQWSSEWVIRLGDGTEESRNRLANAFDYLWPYTGEFFIPASYEAGNTSVVNLALIETAWAQKVSQVLEEATIWAPAAKPTYMHRGGKEGVHTEHLGFVLAEMQYLQKTYPGAQW